MAKRILRPDVVQERLGIGKTKFWEDVKNGVLPPLVRLGPHSVGMLEDELDAYIDGLRTNRDAAIPAHEAA